jgi:hypothetical protein
MKCIAAEYANSTPNIWAVAYSTKKPDMNIWTSNVLITCPAWVNCELQSRSTQCLPKMSNEHTGNVLGLKLPPLFRHRTKHVWPARETETVCAINGVLDQRRHAHTIASHTSYLGYYTSSGSCTKTLPSAESKTSATEKHHHRLGSPNAPNVVVERSRLGLGLAGAGAGAGAPEVLLHEGEPAEQLVLVDAPRPPGRRRAQPGVEVPAVHGALSGIARVRHGRRRLRPGRRRRGICRGGPRPGACLGLPRLLGPALLLLGVWAGVGRGDGGGGVLRLLRLGLLRSGSLHGWLCCFWRCSAPASEAGGDGVGSVRVMRVCRGLVRCDEQGLQNR